VTAVICGFVAEFFELRAKVRGLMGKEQEKIDGVADTKAIKSE
jgi:hypothetical protein